MVIFLVSGATIFSYFLALSTIPTTVSAWIAGLGVSKYLVLTIIIGIYLFLGCFLDAVSMMVLTLPVVFPIVISLGFDPIWFGVVAVLMMEAGLITPPVGLNVYTLAGIARDVPMSDIFRGVTPFLLGIFVLVVFLTIFPQVVTFLPNMMGR
jgi:TRAP-type C4-dicarboxylate transport system permease large subunit